ncbi:MAG: HEAT repeat domain-containing protein, partial [Planctomycetes bacterium]|nr:HEAT repeat domain-containing protein [Planctomycetota bacterium]
MTRLLDSLAVLAALAVARGQDPAKDLRHKDPVTRLAAVEVLRSADRPDAEKLLVGALDDRDWEVQERAALALARRPAANTQKLANAQKALIALALDGELVRIRRAAAEALRVVDPVRAAPALLKAAKPKTFVRAHEALAIVARDHPGLVDDERLRKALAGEEPLAREAAAAAWLACATDRAAALRSLLESPSIALRCVALEGVLAGPREADGEVLGGLLAGPPQNDVVERRALQAMRAWIVAAPDLATSRARAVLTRLGSPALALTRRARLSALLATGEGAPLSAADATELLLPCLEAAEARPRAAAAKALRQIGGEAALALALTRYEKDNLGNVRLQALESVVALRGVDAAEEAAWLAAALHADHDPSVRERAAVLLGRPKTPGATRALAEAVADPDWIVAVCAAVSLGKVGDDEGIAPLVELTKHAQWMRRGAAAVGLMHMNRAAAIEPLIELLGDATPLVARSALEALRLLADRGDLGPEPKAWRACWAEHGARHVFRDRRASIERQRKYGYEVPDSEIYRGLDVVVFTSRGDHIEHLLTRLAIDHRRTEANQVTACGVHPEAIFVVNCTGEIEAADVDPLTWFVRTGGALFGSCWALSQTIEKLHPGVLRKFETPSGEVLDDVRAAPCQGDSPFLRGVFQPGVTPIYHLEGAHLIEVLDPERAEVLIDSRDAAERHGCGNLAAYFHSGHGVVLDSANHFDLQGLEVAQGPTTERERQIYALDH